MRLTVIADDEQRAMAKAIDKEAEKGVELTALRAWKFAPNYAPQAWYVEGYTRLAPREEEARELVPA